MLLETERLLLRDFEADDWRATLAYQSDPRYLRYNPWDGRAEQDVRSFVQMFLDQQREAPRRKFQLAIVLRAEQRMIGNCGIRVDAPESRRGNIGYELDPE